MPSEGADAAHEPDRRRVAVSAGIVLAVLALDQATKAWAVSELPGSPISIVGDDVELAVTRNRGGAFSLFQGFTPLLALLAVAIAFFLVRAVRRADSAVVVVALSLVLGGAVGNLADRLFRSPGFGEGAVVDFVRLGWWPTFNVADAAITVGIVILVLWALFASDDEPAAT